MRFVQGSTGFVRLVQLSRETSVANIISAFEPGRIRIGQVWHSGHVVVSRTSVHSEWAPKPPSEWAYDDLSLALSLRPEILLLGAGPRQIVPDVELMAMLARENIGVEIMTTAAACRTYNVLAHEERAVVAALYNPTSDSRAAR